MKDAIIILHHILFVYGIAGNFRGGGQNICGSVIFRGIFSWLLLALQLTVGKVALFLAETFVVRPSTTKTLPHENYPLYGNNEWFKLRCANASHRCFAFFARNN